MTGRAHTQALVMDAEALVSRALGGSDRSDVLSAASGIVERGLAEGVASAVDHPQGFACLVLASTPDADLRLHVWAADRKPAFLCTVHDHVWDLASLILAGGLRNRFFSAVPDERGQHELHAVSYSGRENKLRTVGGPRDLSILSEQRYGPGDAYTFASGILHDSTAEEERLTATLLVARRRSGRDSPVVVRPRGTAPLTVERRRLSPARAEGLVLAVLARAERRGAA